MVEFPILEVVVLGEVYNQVVVVVVEVLVVIHSLVVVAMVQEEEVVLGLLVAMDKYVGSTQQFVWLLRVRIVPVLNRLFSTL